MSLARIVRRVTAAFVNINRRKANNKFAFLTKRQRSKVWQTLQTITFVSNRSIHARFDSTRRSAILPAATTIAYKWNLYTIHNQELPPCKKQQHRFRSKGFGGYRYHKYVNLLLLCPAGLAVAGKAGQDDDEERDEEQEKQSIYRILLTGGPCAGKSTSMSTLQEFLTNHGFVVFTVPEAATLLIMQGGFKPSLATLPIFQNAITATQHALEKAYFEYAQEIQPSYGKPIVILIDRGIMEGAAYVNAKLFDRILKHALHTEQEIDTTALLNSKYDLILHLVTAAIGAETFYQNEVFRGESIEDAIALDKRLQNVYKTHRDCKIVHNISSFDEKLSTLMSYVADKLNIANLTRKTWRFTASMRGNITDIDRIVQELQKTVLPEHPLTVTYVIKYFLKDDQNQNAKNSKNVFTFIQETNVLDVENGQSVYGQIRNIGDHSLDSFFEFFDHENPSKAVADWEDATHFMLVQSREDFGQVISESETLTETRYDELRKYSRDRQKQRVEKVTIFFHYKQQFFGLNVYIKPNAHKDTMWLKLYRTPGDKNLKQDEVDIEVPPCLKILKNVTNDEDYSSFSLAGK